MFKKFFSWLYGRNEPVCKIEKIDITHQTVVITCRGIETAIWASIEEVIFDRILISSLPLSQVSWLGYSYGKFFLQSRNTHTECPVVEELENDSYILFCLDREGYLIYIDKTTQKQYRKLPMEILSEKKILQGFSRQQILYIGIQAGIYSNCRKTSKITEKSKIRHLHLVRN